tara:strand:- start:299 stop:616 length:318 start_codon:yes stop_codon:yes gene_type:complete
MTIINTTDKNFAETIKSDKPVLVDFWASWCAPCKMIAPILEEISNEMGDKITIAKHNIDDFPSVPVKYNIRGIPTMLIFSKSELKDTKVGATTKSNLLEFINKNI